MGENSSSSYRNNCETTASSTFQLARFHNHVEIMERLQSGDYDENSFPELNTDACLEPTTSPTKTNKDIYWLDESDVLFQPIPQFQTDLQDLQNRFKHDSEFREVVFPVMKHLLVPENVMALTTNPLFGQLWRLVCRCREDKRLDGLESRLGGCIESKLLSEHERSSLKAWLEASYDFSEEINAAIRAKSQECTQFYLMDALAQQYVPDAARLRSLARAPVPSALRNVQMMLSHMVVVDNNIEGDEGKNLAVDEDGNCRCLPVAFDDYELFTMLPHLIQAGTRFSLKPAAMLAILCCKNPDSLLEARARRFLVAIRGKWLPSLKDPIDRHEILSYEFSALLATCPRKDEVLTDEEHHFFVRLHEIWRYRRGRETEFDVSTHVSPKRPMLLPDFKERCHRCGEWTSTTLMVPQMDGSNVCGLCIEMESPDYSVDRPGRPRRGSRYSVEKEESYMVECTACHALYAVLRPALLNILPKCHYCRGLDKERRARLGAPYQRCGTCHGKWCHPAMGIESNDESGTYTCPVCAHGGGKARTCTHKVTLKNLVEQNPSVVTQLGFRKKATPFMFSHLKISQAMLPANRRCLFSPPKCDATTRPLELEHKGKRVLGAVALVATIKDTIATASFTGTCNLCFVDFATEKLFLACGHCSNRCCRDCLESWYRQNAPGKLFIPSYDMCPFCRQRPQYRVLSRYNNAACGIVGLSRRRQNQPRLRPDWYYGWCRRCWRVSFALTRTCAQNEVPQLDGFVCEDCMEKERLASDGAFAALDTKPCPGCNVPTTHAGGCSHMTCPNCSYHWCWECGIFKATEGSAVYEHMRSVHGGHGWQ